MIYRPPPSHSPLSHCTGCDSQQRLSDLVTTQDTAKQWSLIPTEYLVAMVYSEPNHW